MDSKEAIRAMIKDKFSYLNGTDKLSMDKKIRKNIYKLKEYQKANTIFSYVSKDKEVDTLKLISHSFEINKIVGVPLIKENHELITKKIQNLGQLNIGKFNILEPSENLKTIDPNDFEILFVPGLAFGTGFERLGRGGGYFDRFLTKSSGIKIGLAYEFQVFSSLPILDYDIKMDMIITNERIICRA